MRYSDEKLANLDAKFDAHVRDEEVWRNAQDERWATIGYQLERVITVSENNTQAIAGVIEETRGLVQLQKDFQGAARIGSNLQQFLLWVAKWGVIGAGLAALAHTVLDFIDGHF